MTSGNETVEYIERVGTIFAVAMYRDSARRWHEKAAKANEAKYRIIAKLKDHFNSDGCLDDENQLDAAFESFEAAALAKAAEYESLESEAIRLGLPGTSPGQQSHLNGNGIDIRLADVERDLANPGMH